MSATTLELMQAVKPGEAANPTMEYVVYGTIAAVIIFLVVKAIKQRNVPLPERKKIQQPAAEYKTRPPETIQAEAREAFAIPEVQSGLDANGRTRVRLASAAETPPPTRDSQLDNAKKAEEAPASQPAQKPAQKPAALARPARMEAAGATLREGLRRTHEGFIKRLGRLFSGQRQIDDALLGEIEEALFTADIGVKTSQKLVDLVQESAKRGELKDPAKVWASLKDEIANILGQSSKPLDFTQHRPFVVMVVGVNGAGKTTTLGKLAAQYKAEGKRVMLAAGDTFRAAAVEQLEVWADRADVPLVKGPEKADPASVVFEACKRAEKEKIDILLIDTAGRLQAKKELMDELAKLYRVAGKALPGAPHEVWLVLDSTTGQNALSQAREFQSIVSVTGLCLTKLDGTAKGGVIIGVCDELSLPVRYIGIGERVADLRPFDPQAFTEALFGDA